MKIIEDGLLVRSFHGADAQAVHRACQDPLIQRWTMVPVPYRPEDAHTFVTGTAPDTLAGDSAAHLGVFDPATGDLLGSCGFVDLDLTRGTAEIGYWTAPWARGQAVAVRACRIVARWGLQTLGLRRIVWRAMVGNHASRLVALRTGFRLDGVVRAGMSTRDGGWTDAWIGSLLPGDLEPADTGATTGGPAALPAGPGSPHALQAAVFGGPQPVLAAETAGGPIRLRPPRAGDVDAIVASCQDAESLRWTSLPPTYGRADAEFFVGPHTHDRWTRGAGAVYAIAGPDDAYAGTVELRISADDPEVADVGFLVAADARGRGYAPAALRALCGWAFSALGLARIEWRAYVGNDASRRVADKAGFTIEGTARAGLKQRDTRRDAWFGALLASDLAPDAPDGPVTRGRTGGPVTRGRTGGRKRDLA